MANIRIGRVLLSYSPVRTDWRAGLEIKAGTGMTFVVTEDPHVGLVLELQTAAVGGVSSVFGRSGAVVATTGDYTPAQVGADAAGTAAGLVASEAATRAAADATHVVGPASATDTALVAWDGTTGKLVKNTSLTVVGGVVTGLTGITVSADWTLTQNGAAVIKSENTGALASTLYLKAGKVGFRNSSPTYSVDVSGDLRVTGALSGAGITCTSSYTLGNLAAVNVTPTRTGTATGYFAALAFEAQLNTDGAVTVGDLWGITGNARVMNAANVSRAVGVRATIQHTSSGTTTNAYAVKVDGITKSAGTIVNSYGVYIVACNSGSTLNYGFYAEAGMANYLGGYLGIGVAAPTARLHLPAGTTGASTAPLKMNSGALMTAPEAGAHEFLTDDYYVTITTGAARKALVLDDGARLTSGKIPIASTNGRLIDTVLSATSLGLVVPKTLGAGILVDTASPTFGWRNLLGSIVVETVGVNSPDWVVYRGAIQQYRMTNGHAREIWVNFSLPHDYVPGTDVFIGVNWSQATVDTGGPAGVPGTAVWGFDVSYSQGYGTPGGAGDPFNAVLTTSQTQQGSTTQYGHMTAESAMTVAGGSATLIDSARLVVGGDFLIRVYCDSADALHTLDQDPFLHFVHLKYQSTNMATKTKNSPFYT